MDKKDIAKATKGPNLPWEQVAFGIILDETNKMGQVNKKSMVRRRTIASTAQQQDLQFLFGSATSYFACKWT